MVLGRVPSFLPAQDHSKFEWTIDMNLIQIREKFRDISGRYDLVDDDATGTADFLINSGSRFLDRLSEVQKTYATYYKILDPLGWNVQIPYCRAVKEVWVASTDIRWELKKKPLDELLRHLMNKKVDQLQTGPSHFYSPLLTQVVGTVPETINDYIDTIVSQGQQYNAVLILPPPDIQLLVSIVGFFYSADLVEDTDSNFWTVVNPNILLKAAFRELEVFNQNAERVAAWEKAITLELDGVNKDLVEEMIVDIDQMEG
jgi:hypothetical protein